MPTYIYRCNACSHQFEKKQRFSDAPLQDCPQCHNEHTLRKVVNSVGVVFKGNGFYVTDNRGKNGSSAAANGKNGANGKTDTTSKETVLRKKRRPKPRPLLPRARPVPLRRLLPS